MKQIIQIFFEGESPTLTDYEELSYWQFNRNLSICVSLADDWFLLLKKFNQELAT